MPAERFVPDMLEHGGPLRGEPQTLDRRLFFRLTVYTGCSDPRPVVEAIQASGVDAAVYLSAADPRGVGVLMMSEDPAAFTGPGRAPFTRAPLATLQPLPEFTMLGRTYATGREPDLEDWLLRRQRRNALDPAMPWAIWYPLRRTGAFARLPREEQMPVLAEHATLGRAYGEAGLAHDIRLECHGLDRDDNEFVIGIVGPALHPLSKLIRDMRTTVQTSTYIQKMGPFFIGRALWQSPV